MNRKKNHVRRCGCCVQMLFFQLIQLVLRMLFQHLFQKPSKKKTSQKHPKTAVTKRRTLKIIIWFPTPRWTCQIVVSIFGFVFVSIPSICGAIGCCMGIGGAMGPMGAKPCCWRPCGIGGCTMGVAWSPCERAARIWGVVVGGWWLVGWLGGWVGLGWVGLGWVGLGWVGLGWVGLGWVGLGWVGLGWVGLGWVGLGWVGLGWVGLGWVGLGWVGLGWVGLGWVGLGWVGLGWVGLGWVGLGWVGLGWVGLGWVGLGWVGLGWLVGWLFLLGCLEILCREKNYTHTHLLRCKVGHFHEKKHISYLVSKSISRNPFITPPKFNSYNPPWKNGWDWKNSFLSLFG